MKKANLGDSKDSFDSDEEEEHMRVTIKPKARPVVSGLEAADGFVPKLAAPIKLLPPPKSPSRQTGYQVQPDRFNPFDKVNRSALKFVRRFHSEHNLTDEVMKKKRVLSSEKHESLNEIKSIIPRPIFIGERMKILTDAKTWSQR